MVEEAARALRLCLSEVRAATRLQELPSQLSIQISDEAGGTEGSRFRISLLPEYRERPDFDALAR